MLKIHTFAELEHHSLPPEIARQVRRELLIVLELSGGQQIDNEYGRVFVLEKSDDNASVEFVLGRSFDQLLFEGVSCRAGCFVCYLSGGGNECLNVLICSECDLTQAWETKLLAEI